MIDKSSKSQLAVNQALATRFQGRWLAVAGERGARGKVQLAAYFLGALAGAAESRKTAPVNNC